MTLRQFFVREISLACVLLIAHGAAIARSGIERSDPPVQGFFAKSLDCEGIPVRSSAAVEDRALQIACDKITRMLAGIPEAREQLARSGAELHIIGRDEQTSDLPEFRDQRGRTYVDNTGHATTIDERTRGKGGLLTSCGEENLLRLPSDRYRGGNDICIHEFSHAIMGFGFGNVQRRAIRDQYERAMRSGLWRGSYAATNAAEYWAELSAWYFGFHGSRRIEGQLPGDGPEGLRSYDPEGYFLLDRLYNGR